MHITPPRDIARPWLNGASFGLPVALVALVASLMLKSEN